MLEDAQVYDGDPIGHAHRFDLVMCHIDHGLFDFTLQMFKLRPHLSPECSIEIAQRLVQQKDVGMDDGGAAYRQTLHFVDIEPPGRPVEFVR